MHFSRRADDAALAAFLQGQGSELSYPEVGASLGALPPGYRHDAETRVLGSGSRVFERAVAGLRSWRAHRGAGVRVFPEDAPIEEGTSVALALPLLGLSVFAACRIVSVVSQPGRFGFAYGTLAAHPERGEEAFLVEDHDGEISFRIVAFSEPADILSRLGSPVARLVQRRVTASYFAALASFVEHGD